MLPSNINPTLSPPANTFAVFPVVTIWPAVEGVIVRFCPAVAFCIHKTYPSGITEPLLAVVFMVATSAAPDGSVSFMNDEFVWLYLTESTPEEPLAACVAYPGRGAPLPYIAAVNPYFVSLRAVAGYTKRFVDFSGRAPPERFSQQPTHFSPRHITTRTGTKMKTIDATDSQL